MFFPNSSHSMSSSSQNISRKRRIHQGLGPKKNRKCVFESHSIVSCLLFFHLFRSNSGSKKPLIPIIDLDNPEIESPPRSQPPPLEKSHSQDESEDKNMQPKATKWKDRINSS